MQSTGLGHKCATTGMTWDQACRRAGGRRAYNRMRQFRADYRLMKVVELLHQTGLGRGWQSRVAEALGVSRSTICRDFQRLRRRAMFGLESDKIARGLALAAKHARDDARADREYEARKKAALAASSNELATPEVDDRFDRARSTRRASSSALHAAHSGAHVASGTGPPSRQVGSDGRCRTAGVPGICVGDELLRRPPP